MSDEQCSGPLLTKDSQIYNSHLWREAGRSWMSWPRCLHIRMTAAIVTMPWIVYDRNLFLFNKQKQIYCTQIFTENLFNRKIKYITVANRNTLIFCLFLLFPWFVSVGLSVSFLFYTNEQQKMNRKPISCFCSVSTIQFSVATETKITERNKQ